MIGRILATLRDVRATRRFAAQRRALARATRSTHA